jgi:hypothetical protein
MEPSELTAKPKFSAHEAKTMNDETTKKAVDNWSKGNEFELRPRYDFIKGVRGKYAGHFSEGLTIEQFPEHAQLEAVQMLNVRLQS